MLFRSIQSRLDKTKLSIQERAAEKLLASMGVITQDKLENCTVKEAAQVASQMSQVFRNMTSQTTSNEGLGKSGVKIVIHQPKVAREEHFESIEIGVT